MKKILEKIEKNKKLTIEEIKILYSEIIYFALNEAFFNNKNYISILIKNKKIFEILKKNRIRFNDILFLFDNDILNVKFKNQNTVYKLFYENILNIKNKLDFCEIIKNDIKIEEDFYKHTDKIVCLHIYEKKYKWYKYIKLKNTHFYILIEILKLYKNSILNQLDKNFFEITKDPPIDKNYKYLLKKYENFMDKNLDFY